MYDFPIPSYNPAVFHPYIHKMFRVRRPAIPMCSMPDIPEINVSRAVCVAFDIANGNAIFRDEDTGEHVHANIVHAVGPLGEVDTSTINFSASLNIKPGQS